jgi:hypothetical protein
MFIYIYIYTCMLHAYLFMFAQHTISFIGERCDAWRCFVYICSMLHVYICLYVCVCVYIYICILHVYIYIYMLMTLMHVLIYMKTYSFLHPHYPHVCVSKCGYENIFIYITSLFSCMCYIMWIYTMRNHSLWGSRRSWTKLFLVKALR